MANQGKGRGWHGHSAEHAAAGRKGGRARSKNNKGRKGGQAGSGNSNSNGRMRQSDQDYD